MMSLARFVNIEYRFTDVFDDKSTKEPHKPKDSDQNYLGRYFCLLFDILLWPILLLDGIQLLSLLGQIYF